MRHRKKFNHLSRKAPHRKAMLANMASSLILHKRITTTTAKAKALRTFVEPVITRSREDSTHSRRIAFKHLRDKHAVTELFREVAGKVGDRPGGYTRIIKLGNRPGDNADMCIIELVDYNENLLAEKAAAKPKSTRRRRGGKKKADQPEGIPAAETTDLTEEYVAEPEAKAEETEVPAEPEAEVKADETETVAEPEAGVKDEAAAKDKNAGPEAKNEKEAPAEEETKEEGEKEKKEE
jgi:large subunit ribosomal protein L17